jgi:hypothetical protein
MRRATASSTQYAVMFVPIVAGIVLGSLAAERLAGRVASARLILAGLSIQLVTGIVNVTFHTVHAATVLWSILPLGFYAFGMSLATPGLLLTGLDRSAIGTKRRLAQCRLTSAVGGRPEMVDRLSNWRS